jgi:hypothetical protein
MEFKGKYESSKISIEGYLGIRRRGNKEKLF